MPEKKTRFTKKAASSAKQEMLSTYKDMVQRFLDAARLLTPGELQAVAHDTGKRVFVKGGSKS